jgi:galactokinase/mevalonate kinase-like predicted kinase
MEIEEKYLNEKITKVSKKLYSNDTRRINAQLLTAISKKVAKLQPIIDDLIENAYQDGYDRGYEEGSNG